MNMLKSNRKKRFGCNLFAELRGRGTTTNLLTVPKIATPNKMLVMFFYPKTSQNRKFQNSKNSLDHPRSLSHFTHAAPAGHNAQVVQNQQLLD